MKIFHAILLATTLLALGTACKKRKLFLLPDLVALSEAENAAVQAWMSCRRPVLQGEPANGSPKAQMNVALTGDVAERCLPIDSVKEMREKLHEFEENHLDSLPATSGDCAALRLTVQRTIQHTEVCSSWVGDVESETSLLFGVLWPSLLRVDVAARLHAWGSAQEGKSEQAIAELFNCVRFHDDVARGGVLGVRQLLALGAGNDCLGTLEQLLNSPLLQMKSITRWLRQLDLIRQSQVHPASSFAPDVASLTPSGLEKGSTPDSFKHRMALYALTEALLQQQRACIGTTRFTCWQNIVTQSQELENRASQIKTTTPKNGRESSRFSVDLMKSMIVSGKALETPVTRPWKLQGLGIHLHYRHLIDTEKRCPDIKAFSNTPFSELLVDPFGGLPLEVRPTKSGFEIWPSHKLAKAERLWNLECKPSFWEPTTNDSSH